MGKIRYIFLIVVLFIVLSCQIAKNGYSNISITSSLKSRTTSPDNIKLITLVVEGPGIKKETYTSTTNYIEVEVQNGKDRYFILSVDFTDGTRYSGDFLTDIDSSTTQIHIDLLQILDPEIISFSFLSSNNTKFLDADIKGEIDDSSIKIILPTGVSLSDLVATVAVTSGATYAYDKDNNKITVTSREGVIKEYNVETNNSPGLGISVSGVSTFVSIDFKIDGILDNYVDIYEGNGVSIEAQSIPSGVSVQWKLNGQVITGEASSLLSLSASQLFLGEHNVSCSYTYGDTYASGVLTVNVLTVFPTVSVIKAPVLKASSISLEWSPATDNDTLSDDVQYFVSYSIDNSLIDTVSDVLNNTSHVDVESSNSWELGKNLPLVGSNIIVDVVIMRPGFEGKIVFFTLLAKDGNGNTSIYSFGSVLVPAGFSSSGV